ncbi:MAG TPA: hypothetical protein VML92_09980 [Steroidobacteraceae bacterium]|nr:hypothetical protein [Steroidobacteraceae bacterium]
MNPDDTARTLALLEQIRDNQAAALAMQKEQFELFSRQVERSELLQDRAEELQARGAGIMNTARRSLAFVLPVVILLIAYLTWLIFR